MSARPGLCGGHQATGVPTAINSYWGHPVHNTGLQELERKLDDIRAKSDSVKKM